MRVSKLNSIIEHGSETLKELHSVYDEGMAVSEYRKLLHEYKRLSKRYTKIIKISDRIEQKMLTDNDNLSDAVVTTIDKAREKIKEKIKLNHESLEEIRILKEYINVIEDNNLKIQKRVLSR